MRTDLRLLRRSSDIDQRLGNRLATVGREPRNNTHAIDSVGQTISGKSFDTANQGDGAGVLPAVEDLRNLRLRLYFNCADSTLALQT
jgi:hypothetical protein